jgi:hypothetical protein
MKSIELRSGNLLYYEHTTHIVSGVNDDFIYSWWIKEGKPVIEWKENGEKNPYIDIISHYEPIPLTDEWMFNFGFKKHKAGMGGADMWQGMSGWGINSDEWLFRGDTKGGLKLVGYFNTNILYVHQLQNLYFDLTGEELTIKL